jgi:hypothetical protein
MRHTVYVFDLRLPAVPTFSPTQRETSQRKAQTIAYVTEPRIPPARPFSNTEIQQRGCNAYLYETRYTSFLA